MKYNSSKLIFFKTVFKKLLYFKISIQKVTVLKIPKAQGTLEAQQRRRKEEKPIKKRTKRRSSPFDFVIISFIIFMGCNLIIQGDSVKNYFLII